MGRSATDIFGRQRIKKMWKKMGISTFFKLIEIVQDMWTHRNDTLHGKQNAIHDRLHDEIDELIEQTYKLIPSHLRVFSPSEQRFLTVQQ